MRAPALALLIATAAALPAAAQDYFTTATEARHGNGYTAASIVAGQELETSFSVLSIVPGGERISGGQVTTEWRAILITGPKRPAEEEDDERYLENRRAARPAPSGAPVPRTETTWTSLTCPAVLSRMEALKPLTTFEFNPPSMKGNQDGPAGSNDEGFNLWLRIGAAELDKSAATGNSALGRWYLETVRALSACPAITPPKP